MTPGTYSTTVQNLQDSCMNLDFQGLCRKCPVVAIKTGLPSARILPKNLPRDPSQPFGCTCLTLCLSMDGSADPSHLITTSDFGCMVRGSLVNPMPLSPNCLGPLPDRKPLHQVEAHAVCAGLPTAPLMHIRLQ